MPSHDSSVMVEMGLSPLPYTSGAASCQPIGSCTGTTPSCWVAWQGLCSTGLTGERVSEYNIYRLVHNTVVSLSFEE